MPSSSMQAVMTMIYLALLPALATASTSIDDVGAPYRQLQQANRALDPDLAASAYAKDAVLSFDYQGAPKEQFRGRAAVRASYVRTFGQLPAGAPVALEFRFAPPGLRGERQAGAYKVVVKIGARTVTSYGKFQVRLVRDDGQWRFAEDVGTDATAAEFEALLPEASDLAAPEPTD
jgi:hypothetical protein